MPPADALHGAGVGAAAREDAELVGDLFRLGDGFELINQTAVGDEGAVHHRQSDAGVLFGDALVLGGAGGIYGERGVDRDGDVRLGGVGGGAGAAQADFFLHRGGEDDFVLQLLHLPPRFDGDEGSYAVVQALAADAVADLVELRDKCDGIADADFLLHLVRRQAQVDEEVADLGDLLLVLFLGDVNGPADGVHQADQIFA